MDMLIEYISISINKMNLCGSRLWDCQAQQIHHVSDGRGYDKQEIVCRDIVSDRTIAMLFCLAVLLFGLIQGIRVSQI